MGQSNTQQPDAERDNRAAVDAYFAAMRQGPDAESALLELFTDDAVYQEPFSGIGEPAVGLIAIRERMRAGWQDPPPEMELDVLSLTIDGSAAISTWECRSPAFEQPARGTDHYRFRDGQICELRVTLEDGPTP